jgi:urea carboxylase
VISETAPPHQPLLNKYADFLSIDDLITFYEVSVEDYDALDALYQAGQYHFEVKEGVFDVEKSWQAFETAKRDTKTVSYKERQLKALNEQTDLENKLYAEWVAETADSEPVDENYLSSIMKNEGTVPVMAPMAANVWKVMVEVGDTVDASQPLAVLEAMKMEIAVNAPNFEGNGKKIKAIVKKPGSMVNAGDVLMVLN